MKTKKLLALLLAAAMTLSLAGCLVPDKDTETETAAPTAGSNPNPTANVDTTFYDSEAAAIELGDIVITAGEIEESYSYYINMLQSYYGVDISDDESIREYREMAITDLIHYYVPQWKANELGITLTAEEEAEIENEIAATINDLRTDLICEYAYYYGGAAEIYTDVSFLSEEELAGAMEEIDAELSEYYRPGYTLEEYLADQQKSQVSDARIVKLTEKLRLTNGLNFTVNDEQIEAWYTETLASQQEEFDQDRMLYRDTVTAFLSGDSTVPALYMPEGVLRVQIIEIAPDSARDIKIDMNREEMAALEAEYGKLVLNGEDVARQEEILARYTELKADNDLLEEAFIGDARTKINKAYEALEEETAFEDVMKLYNAEGSTAETILFAEGDAIYGELCNYAAELLVGTYSEPILIDDVYYIVKLLEKPASGAVDRATIADAIHTAAADATMEADWDTLYAEWESEAERVAIRHEDAYAAIGYIN